MAKVTIIPAREAKNRFGEMLDRAQRSPVTIGKRGRPVAVLLAGVDFEEYQRFREIEDRIWGERALKAEKGGYLGPEESDRFVEQMRRRHAHSRSR